MCDYTGRHFGASYPDACCIDGYLWDLDSCDEPGGALSVGGDQLCPRCSTAEFLRDARDDLEAGVSGYVAVPGFKVSWTGQGVWNAAVSLAERENPEAARLFMQRLAEERADD